MLGGAHEHEWQTLALLYLSDKITNKFRGSDVYVEKGVVWIAHLIHCMKIFLKIDKMWHQYQSDNNSLCLINTAYVCLTDYISVKNSLFLNFNLLFSNSLIKQLALFMKHKQNYLESQLQWER